MDDRPEPDESAEAVAAYKAILRHVIDTRPSGTRQRLAGALGKNRSFVSQITNPAYATPIPVRHIETVFEVCHFSNAEKSQFLAAYTRAHPRRVPAVRDERRLRAHTIYLPDFGEAKRNRELDQMVADFVQRLTRLIDHS